MKSVVLAANGVLDLEERSVPDTLPDECLVDIRAAGVCSSDIARGFEGGAYHYPLVMGHEAAGRIERIGAEVADLRVGDRVALFPLLPCFSCDSCRGLSYARCRSYDYYGSRRDGAFTEKLAVKAWNLVRVPDEVADRDAALAEPTAVVVHAVDRLLGGATEGELLVLGGGFLGLTAAAVMRFMAPDVRVTVADRNPRKLETAAGFGALSVHVPDERAMNELVADRGASWPFVLEAAGTPSSFRHSLRLAAPGGRVLWMGNISDDLALPKAEVSQILRKELSVIGSWNSDYRSGDRDDWTKALALMAQGFRPSALADRIVPLDAIPDEIAALHRYKRTRTGPSVVKVMAVRSDGAA